MTRKLGRGGHQPGTRKWSDEKALAAYREVAESIGYTPRFADLYPALVHALHKFGYTLPKAALACGYTPNRHKHPPEPLPSVTGQPEPEKIVVFEAPRPAWALTPEQLAEEREASRERVRRRMAEEPAHRPLPGTPRERSRAFRVGRSREEIAEDERAMREMLAMQGAA